MLDLGAFYAFWDAEAFFGSPHAVHRLSLLFLQVHPTRFPRGDDMNHEDAYDERKLAAALRDAGFARCERRRFDPEVPLVAAQVRRGLQSGPKRARVAVAARVDAEVQVPEEEGRVRPRDVVAERLLDRPDGLDALGRAALVRRQVSINRENKSRFGL